MLIDYSQVVDLVTQIITVALPVGIIFALAGKAVHMFMDMVTGKEHIRF